MDTGAAKAVRDPWHLTRRDIGDELLASLLGVSASSVRRYATGARTPPRTPDRTRSVPRTGRPRP